MLHSFKTTPVKRRGWVTYLGFSLALLVITVGAYLSYRNLQATRVNQALTVHSDSVILGMERMLSSMKDAETAMRGYVISNDSAFFRPYDAALDDVEERYSLLVRMTADNPDQAVSLRKLRTAMDIRLFALNDLRSRPRDGHPTSTEIWERSIKGQTLMDTLRHQVAAMISVEQALLAKRARSSELSFTATIFTIAASAITGIILLLLLLLLRESRSVAQSRNAQEIADQRELLRVTLSSIGDALISTDPKGTITFLNTVAEDLTGWKNEDAIGRPIDAVFNILDEETREPIPNPASIALAQGSPTGLKSASVLVAKDGSEHPIDDSAAPITNIMGVLVGSVLIFRDIGQQRAINRAIERSEARKTAIFETALDCIISMDSGGTIVEFNAAAEHTFGHDRKNVLGRELAEVIIPPRYRDAHRNGLAHYLSSGEGSIINQRIELSALRADGTEFPCELTVTRVPIPGDPLFTAYLRDLEQQKASAEALRESDQMLRSALEAAELGTWSVNLHTGRSSSDQRYKEIFGTAFEGTPANEANGRMHPDDVAEVRHAVEASLDPKRQAPFSEEYRIWPEEGTMRWVHSKGRAAFEPDGDGLRATRFTGTVADITERKRLDEALRRSETFNRVVQENNPDCMLVLDAQGLLLHINTNGLLQWERTDADDLHGRDWGELWPEEARAEVQRNLDEARTTGTARFVRSSRTGKGNTKWWDVSIASIRGEEEVTGYVAMARDITEQRKSEAELRANEQRLRQMAVHLNETDRRKNEFLAMLAHELRNPLAPIRTAIDLLEMDEDDPDTRKTVTAMMQRQVAQMVRLVDDLLDVSRVSSGKIVLRKETMDIIAVVHQAVEAVQPSLDELQQHLLLDLEDGPLPVFADPARMAQVVGNLLSNASKFSHRGSTVEVEVKTAAGMVIITVRDHGIGISEKDLPRIFDLFAQADTSLERSSSGLGIGLTLVKNIMLLHGGTVDAQSDGADQGCAFTLQLPLGMGLPVNATGTIGTGKSRGNRKLKVLVVDDNQDAATSLRLLLEKLGHEPHCAQDGQEAIAAARDLQPDLMLLDIGLPIMNGYEVASHIREQAWGRSMRIVALTGWGKEEDKRRSADAGFDDHLVKPVDLDHLARTLEMLAQHEQ